MPMWTRKQAAEAKRRLDRRVKSGQWRKEFDELYEQTKAGDEEAAMVIFISDPGIRYPDEHTYAQQKLAELKPHFERMGLRGV